MSKQNKCVQDTAETLVAIEECGHRTAGAVNGTGSCSSSLPPELFMTSPAQKTAIIPKYLP
jgi:hypothetical protein